MPKRTRKRAIDKAVAFVTERLNGIDGLGAIYPAMENSVKMYAVLGYPPDHPHRAIARASIDKLLVIKEDEAYCQPCVSPVWDTALVTPRAARGGRRDGGRGRKPRARLAQAAAGARREGRLDRAAPERASGRLGIPVQQRALSRPRRHRGGRDGDGSCAGRARSGIRHCDRSRARVDRRAAEPRWRLRRLRCRQRLPLSQQHPVRRSRRAARSADRGPHGALPLDAGAARRAARDLRADAPGDRLARTRPVT